MNKQGVAKAHIETAIQMIAVRCDPISIHVVVMACEEILLSLSKHRNLTLGWDYRLWVRDEHHREYRDAIRKVYNFAKHADRDGDALYSGPPLDKLCWVNEVQTLFNIQGLIDLGGDYSPSMAAYLGLLCVKHPDLFNKELLLTRHPILRPGYERCRDDLIRDPDLWFAALRCSLQKNGALPLK